MAIQCVCVYESAFLAALDIDRLQKKKKKFYVVSGSDLIVEEPEFYSEGNVNGAPIAILGKI